MSDITILKADGAREQFQQEKLTASLSRAGATHEVSSRILSHVERELSSGMSTADIYHHAFSLLREAEKPLAARYSLRRALLGLGPTGFPFEEYVAEIFKAQGYQIENDRIMQGRCVEHETDVVAWNDKKLVIVEVKFHNEIGLKSDLKVALYVKARIDDLSENQFFYGGRERELDEAWLVTNTKFTMQAIKYGECAGLKMIGWNYPVRTGSAGSTDAEGVIKADLNSSLNSGLNGGNLQDLIERYKLHPVSCVTALSAAEKQQLFARRVVLARSLVENPDILESIGLSPAKIAEVREEVDMLII